MGIVKHSKYLFVKIKNNMKTRNTVISIFFLIAIVFHAAMFYLAIGPYNLFTDSAGYLSTADIALKGGGWIFNPNRPIGLPLFFFSLLKISHGYLSIITIFQIIGLIGAIFFAVYSAIPKWELWKKLLITWIIIIFSTRTFLYSYMILSEAFFTVCLLFFLGFFFLYLKAVKEKQNEKYKFLLWGMFLASLSAAWIKSVGVLFLLIFIFILILHFIYYRKNYIQGILIFIILTSSLVINHIFLGTYAFSKQDGIQLLISANEYINYKSSYMSHEKNLIYTSHQKILKMYAPRTRLDQIVGPIPGIETPAQILQKDSVNYDQFNTKIRNLIFEGLMSNGNWIKYLGSGFVELENTILGNTKEGLIIPNEIANSNGTILSWLPTIESISNQPIQLNENPFAVNYYNLIISFGIFPKYVAPIVFLILLVIAIAFHIEWKILAINLMIFLLLIGYLYGSVLLVFALDRYYVGIEILFFVDSLYLINLIVERNKLNNISQ